MSRHFFAAFLVCVLLLAGGLHLAAQSIQELRGEKVVLEVIPPQVRGLMAEAKEAVRGHTRQLLTSPLGGRVAALCRGGLQVIDGIGPILADWIRAGCSPFLQNIRDELTGKSHNAVGRMKTLRISMVK